MTTIILATEGHRTRAAQAVAKAPLGYRVEIKEPKRSTEQNARMWPMLNDLAEQATWHGLKLSSNDWKELISAGLKRELRVVPNIAGDGFVQLGRSTSAMEKREFTELMDLIEAMGARLGVRFQVHAVRFDERGQEIAA